MKVTSKGQITIPKAIREQFGLRPGTEVEVIVRGEDVLIQPRTSSIQDDAIDDWLERFKGSATSKLTTDQFMRVTRGDD